MTPLEKQVEQIGWANAKTSTPTSLKKSLKLELKNLKGVKMTKDELRAFIINEVKTKRPDEADKAEFLADFILSQPPMQSEAGIKGFLKGYLGKEPAQ